MFKTGGLENLYRAWICMVIKLRMLGKEVKVGLTPLKGCVRDDNVDGQSFFLLLIFITAI